MDMPEQKDNNNQALQKPAAPAISLPKGGGAIRGMGEKFAANPVTGTGSMSVPIALSAGRSGFQPELSLTYDSGAGNGPFGLGWNLSLPSITRKTDRGLPQYRDEDEADTFILSGAEDLVPNLIETGGRWLPEEVPDRTIGTETYRIKRYRPRIEGLFARIERWTNLRTRETHWRTISKQNVVTLYGRSTNSRIEDPGAAADSPRVFSWLICESYDDKGNAIHYQYQAEDSRQIDLAQAHERNRSDNGRSANRYLKRIRYGNRTPVQTQSDSAREFSENLAERSDWLFEVVLDYEEGHYRELPPTPGGQHRATAHINPVQAWPTREDAFSSYRAGFEVRTYRLCRRVLMFHHFPDELGVNDYLVRATEFQYRQGPTASVITHAIQSGFKRRADGTYLKRALPPLEFEYSQARIHDTLQEVDAASLVNLPQGVDGSLYQWADLDGEGLAGILTEQGGAWFYKRNLSALPVVDGNGSAQAAARFFPAQCLSTMPSISGLAEGRQQLLDLAGNGQLDAATFESPTPGYFERSLDSDWSSFIPFQALPNIAWQDPNLRFIDLTGDGHADILITGDEAFTWYPSLAELGFASGEEVRHALDDEKGPRLVFADGTESLYLADISGDGLTDLVRIRNGEVCYWPNLGYGRFGSKVSMDNAPFFDAPDLFDQRRIRLADIDGSGVTDILYLSGKGIEIYRNESGNRWANAERLGASPRIDSLASVAVVDLLGNGTACLVWTSPLPSDARNPMRYIDLMGGQKPHLLIKIKNNLGTETEIQYAPSTRFYLADKFAGTPWITKLPFPVHVVEKVSVCDTWRNTRFSSRYSYHHGYFDGAEREFRGFGRVEQIDTESFGEFAAGNAESPYITDDQTLYQPPVKTVTWFHTGVFIDRERILSQYENEYFPNGFERHNPSATHVLGTFRENRLPEPDIEPGELSAGEWREALRACKGMMLRQEVYELEVNPLQQSEARPVKLFSTAYHNCHIRRLQARAAGNRHAVFLVTEAEAITFHYELDLTAETLAPDPRIAHTLNLRTDEYGNVLQSVTAVYPRRGRHADGSLPAGTEDLIARVQNETHLAYTETRFTNDVQAPDQYRLRLPCEVTTFELTGVEPAADYYNLEELRRLHLSNMYQTEGHPVSEIAYHQIPSRLETQKRTVEQVRTLFFAEGLTVPLPLGQLNALGLPCESYQLALTDELLAAVFADKLTIDVRNALGDALQSGYLTGAALDACFPGLPNTGQYWIRSGIAGFASDAAAHFYLPERYTDPFGNITTLQYDSRYDLFVQSSADALGNTTTVREFDYRVLAPTAIEDSNDNLSEVTFDVLGFPAAMALKGKGDEADSLTLTDEELDPDFTTRNAFFAGAFNMAEARRLLGTASARFVYHFGEFPGADGSIEYGAQPPAAASILRERHVPALAPGEESPLQVAFEYSDGGGNVLVKKVQAEPAAAGGPLRWIANGKTILNNKGKPVKQYEPYFTDAHTFAEPVAVGVTPIMYYDAAGRLIRTEMPDSSFSRVEFSPWYVTRYDQNDTVLEAGNAWYAQRTAVTASAEDRRAARLAAEHAGTPATVFLDSLGREVISVTHNRGRDAADVLRDEKYITFIRLDAEGKPLWIRDARGNLVMQYIAPVKPTRAADEPDPAHPEAIPAGSVPCYDIAGNLLFQHSMDAGDRWLINDAAGQPFYTWDVNEAPGSSVPESRLFHTLYDALRRPLQQRLQIGSGPWRIVERFVYGESHPEASARNLRGQVYEHYDSSGLVTSQYFDFKGNLLEVQRRLASAYDAQVVDWSEGSANGGLGDIYTQRTEYDALNRMIRQENWHLAGRAPAIYTPRYNQRGLLAGETLSIRGRVTDVIIDIEYDAKGQRIRIDHGNGTTTRYHYDPQTFRLVQLRTTHTGYDPAFPSARGQFKNERVIQNLFYTYDPVGNITEIYDDAFEPAFFANQRVEARNRYVYDALYRLVEASGREQYGSAGAPTQRLPAAPEVTFPIVDPTNPNALRNYTQYYLYDKVGNIVQMLHSAERGGWTRHYEYAGDSNRLLRTWLGGDEINAVHYNYDTHGSMLNLNRTPDEYHLQWDYRDMIHRVNLGGGGQAYYSYDANKQRTRKRIEHDGSTVEERLYLGGMEHYRRWISGRLVEEIETYHLFADDQRILIIENIMETDNPHLSTNVLFRYQYSNHLGSVGLELNADAAVISYEEYHPYGTMAYQANNSAVRTTAKRYRYTGMERDEETGLSYHTARYYLPWLGRWGSSDPNGLIDGTNMYVYARNYPTGFQDFQGTQSIPIPAIPRWDEMPGTYSDFAGEQEVHLDRVFDFEDEPEHVGGDYQVARARLRFDAASREYRAFHRALSLTVVEGTADLLTLGLYSQVTTLQRIYELIQAGQYVEAIQAFDQLYQITPQARIRALTDLATGLSQLHSDFYSDDPEVRGTARGTAAGLVINIINGLALGAAASGPGTSIGSSVSETAVRPDVYTHELFRRKVRGPRLSSDARGYSRRASSSQEVLERARRHWGGPGPTPDTSELDLGHAGTPHSLLRPGETSTLRAELSIENQARGRTTEAAVARERRRISASQGMDPHDPANPYFTRRPRRRR